MLHGKYTPRFTCAITTSKQASLLQKPRNAPGQQPCLTSQDPEPTPRTSSSGGDNEPADHTAGVRYVQRAQDTSYLDQNLSCNFGRCLQAAALLPYRAPPPAPSKESPVRHLGPAPSCPTAGKHHLLWLTAQGQPYNPGFPCFFHLFPLHFLNLCPEKAPCRAQEVYTLQVGQSVTRTRVLPVRPLGALANCEHAHLKAPVLLTRSPTPYSGQQPSH